jgi:hypothetical protein
MNSNTWLFVVGVVLLAILGYQFFTDPFNAEQQRQSLQTMIDANR